MKQTVHFSATTMGSRERRTVIFVILFAWLAWLLTCPNVMDERSNPVSAGVEEHVSHATAGSTHDTSHNDACCIAAPHTAVLATAQKFNPPAFFILTFVLPVIATWLFALVVAPSKRRFGRSTRSNRTENSPLFCLLWPQAPPR